MSQDNHRDTESTEMGRLAPALRSPCLRGEIQELERECAVLLNAARNSAPTATAPAAVEALLPEAVAGVVKARARALEPIGFELQRLIDAAKNQQIGDAALMEFLTRAQENLPDLFGQVDVAHLADAIENALGGGAAAALQDQRKLAA